MKKAKTDFPELGGLAAETTEASLTQSKVHLLRHLLFRTMRQSYVAVESSSCLQVLEDFLRN